MMTTMATFSCSQHSCKIQRLNTIYFKSCGLAARGFDTLHSLGITMCQKTAYRCIEELSTMAHVSLLSDITNFPWFGCHDNINIPFRAYEQRLNNRDHFDSGTVATIFITKNPASKPPHPFNVRENFTCGSRNPISRLDILDLDNDTHSQLMKHAVYQVLKVLIEATPFDFDTYFYREDPLFDRPTSAHQLSTGREYATCHYMLNTVHHHEKCETMTYAYLAGPCPSTRKALILECFYSQVSCLDLSTPHLDRLLVAC
jgi:Family of unknown function (DUF6589)